MYIYMYDLVHIGGRVGYHHTYFSGGVGGVGGQSSPAQWGTGRSRGGEGVKG